MKFFKILLGLVITLMLMCLNISFAQTPIASYSFDTDASDATGNYNGALENDAAIVNDGIRGQVVELTDSGYVSIPPEIANEMESFSFCGWVRFNGTNPWSALVGMGSDTLGKHPYWDFHLKNDGSIRYYASVGQTWPPDGCSQILDADPVPKNEWTHIAFSFTKNDTGLVYINGVNQPTIPWKDIQEYDVSPSMIGARVVQIGKDAFNQQTLTGTRIDNFKFYNVALTAEQIADIYNAEVIDAEEGLVAHWPMDDSTGTVVTDVVGGNNGTMVGLDPATAWITDGALGGAVRFANINDQRIEVPHSDAIEFGDESFTVSLLVRYVTPPEAGDTDRWLMKGTHYAPAGTGKRYELYHTGGPEVRFTVDDNVTKTDLKVSNEAFITGGWIHVVAVRNAEKDTLYLYANNVLQGTTLDNTGDITNGEPLWIGESTDEHNTPMSGDIDDARIYNYALSTDDVKALFDTYGITTTAQSKVACVGNSITEGWGGNPSYVPTLQKLLGTDYIVENYGKSGATVLKRGNLPYWKQGVFSKVLESNADIITIMLGTNDTKPQNWDSYGSEFKSDYTALIDTLQLANKNAQIFPVIPVPVFEDNYGIRNEILKLEIPIIKEIANEKGLTTIDANTPLLPFSNYFEDGVHPNAAGADTIASVLFRSISEAATSVEERMFEIPSHFSLCDNYPNPFNPSTKIEFQIPQDGHVTLSVYNSLGQHVVTLVDENLKIGVHYVTFNASEFASGIYFYRIQAGDFMKVKKMLLVK